MNQKEKLEEAIVKALRNKLYEAESTQNRQMNLMLRNPEKYGEQLQKAGYTVTINNKKFTKQLMQDVLDSKDTYYIEISKNGGNNDEHQTTYIIKDSTGKMYVSSWDEVSGRYDKEIINKGVYDYVGLLDKRPQRDDTYNKFMDWFDDEDNLNIELGEPELDYNDYVGDFNNINTHRDTDSKYYRYYKKQVDKLNDRIKSLKLDIDNMYKNNKDGSNDENIEKAENEMKYLLNVLDKYNSAIEEIFAKHKKQ